MQMINRRISQTISHLQSRRISAACLIIGDEVLNGKIHDTNSHHLAKLCFQYGITLNKILVVPDIESDIVSSVLSLSSSHDYVFTSGGIGPTHDDITYSAISKAFNYPLQHHSPTLLKMKDVLLKRNLMTEKEELSNERKLMALFPFHPKDVVVYYPIQEGFFWVPIVRIMTGTSSVNILPGVPTLFERMSNSFFHSIIAPLNLTPFHRTLIGTSQLESDIAISLTDIQNAAKEEVKIGSYPHWPAVVVEGRVETVQVSIVGQDAESVEKWAGVVQIAIGGWKC